LWVKNNKVNLLLNIAGYDWRFINKVN